MGSYNLPDRGTSRNKPIELFETSVHTFILKGRNNMQLRTTTKTFSTGGRAGGGDELLIAGMVTLPYW